MIGLNTQTVTNIFRDPHTREWVRLTRISRWHLHPTRGWKRLPNEIKEERLRQRPYDWGKRNVSVRQTFERYRGLKAA